MTADAFITAVKEMNGLPPMLANQLIALAPRMTDQERSDAVAQLTPMNADIEKDQKDILKDLDEGMVTLKKAEKTILPAMRKAESQKEAQKAESLFDDSPASHDA